MGNWPFYFRFLPIKLQQIRCFYKRWLQCIAYMALYWAFLYPVQVVAQQRGMLSGNLEANGNFFIRDTLIGAGNTPQYDYQLYGADAWLNLVYACSGDFEAAVRFDLFQNSNLLNPTGSYTDQGIGRWYLRKQIGKLDLTGGYIYDQIGSGIVFRAYEERPLAIDNALYGLRLAYQLSPNWQIRAFTGRQKQQFDAYASSIRAMAIDGFWTSDSSSLTLVPGIGMVSRTIDDASVNLLTAELATYEEADRFVPHYNTYAVSLYNTLTAGPVVWYVEGAWKSADVMFDPFAPRITSNGDTLVGKYYSADGAVIYSSFSYAQGKLGLTIEGKYTEHFEFRTRPQESANRGLINYLPPMTRVNTYRLTARYNAATQFLGEYAWQADFRYAHSRKLQFNFNISNLTTLEQELLYRELVAEMTYKYKRQWQLIAGIQRQQYNQEVYEVKPGVPLVQTITPYFDFLYKLSRRKAIRVEGQYMATQQDYGSWAFALLEWTWAPHWAFTISDMYNVQPQKTFDAAGNPLPIHYPRIDVYYTQGPNRFSISYVKQVEGVVCSGGICRLEPAFSGVKVTVNSSF